MSGTYAERIQAMREKFGIQKHDEESGERITKINLDDDLLLDTDEDGNEALRLEFICEDRKVKIRIPAYGKWNQFASEVSQLFGILSMYAGNLDIEKFREYFHTQPGFQEWATIASLVLRPKQIKSRVERIFFRYMRPEIEGYSNWYQKPFVKRWCRRNMGVDFIIRMFASILACDEWIKKKTSQILKAIYPHLHQAISSPTAVKSSVGLPNKPTTNPTSSFVPL